MSKAICCDRCGTFKKIVSSNGNYILDVPPTEQWGMISDIFFALDKRDEMNLCPTCYQGFRNYIKSGIEVGVHG